ncbi:PREDICTED: uncharacterized protein LOC106811658 [Priapulus caudatus]|uniref:Uncharacterized protein LOC106811658 n=1 Tax=Priapulus caudatus TaxID=37621 RepID=A0ABM1EF75_PRICU|nr:PREDICTED: uncharacterized protein LOC106811658 [Priapulus caudatus]
MSGQYTGEEKSAATDDGSATVDSDSERNTLKDASTQTEKNLNPSYVNVKIENLVLKNELADLKSKITSKDEPVKFFCVDDVKDNDRKCKFYTGLTWLQFLCVWEFLGPAMEKLTYWNQPLKSCRKSPSKTRGTKRKLSATNELFLTLVRLRTGLLNEDLGYRFGITSSTVSKIVITWVQFMYKQFSGLKTAMFAPRDVIKSNLPPSFKGFKGVRTVIDCTEFHVEQASNFERQGNLYSSYKGHGTYKVLIGVAPCGAVMYVSDAFEGSMSDVEIVKQSGFLDHLKRGDLVIADRGFTIRELLGERGVDLNIPPFLHGRDRLTPDEEKLTRQIARVRIHVERGIERIKKFRLLQKVIPLSLQPIFSQMVFVAGCLVNFQEPLVNLQKSK